MHWWRYSSRSYRDNCILHQGRIHSVPLGYLQPRRTSHSIHIQAGQYLFHHSFFSQLDALYFHIIKQVPETILLSAQFLLFAYAMRYWESDPHMHVSVLCCMFRISEYTSTCRYLLWDAFGFSQLNWLLYRLHTAVLWPRSMVQLGYVNHRPCFKYSWINPFLPQILLRLSSRSCPLWCLLRQHPCNLLTL